LISECTDNQITAERLYGEKEILYSRKGSKVETV
jgi:hypothetical protein